MDVWHYPGVPAHASREYPFTFTAAWYDLPRMRGLDRANATRAIGQAGVDDRVSPQSHPGRQPTSVEHTLGLFYVTMSHRSPSLACKYTSLLARQRTSSTQPDRTLTCTTTSRLPHRRTPHQRPKSQRRRRARAQGRNTSTPTTTTLPGRSTRSTISTGAREASDTSLRTASRR